MPVYVEHVAEGSGSHEGPDSDRVLAPGIVGFRDWGVEEILCLLNEEDGDEMGCAPAGVGCIVQWDRLVG